MVRTQERKKARPNDGVGVAVTDRTRELILEAQATRELSLTAWRLAVLEELARIRDLLEQKLVPRP